jgi:hypothetical protein
MAVIYKPNGKRDHAAEYKQRKAREKAKMENLKNDEPNGEAVDSAEATDSTEQPRKKRGRQPGHTANRAQTGKKEKISARQITGILMLSHGFAANSTGIEQIALDEVEAETIAAALVDVLQFYDFQTSAKTLAWCNLVGTIATVYGLKFMQFRSVQNANTIN